MDDLLEEKYSSGILVDFAPSAPIDLIFSILKYIRNKAQLQRKKILVRNLAMAYLLKFINLEEKTETLEIVIIGEKKGNPSLVFAGRNWDSTYELHEYVRRKKQDNGSLIYYVINCMDKKKNIQKFIPIENYIK